MSVTNIMNPLTHWTRRFLLSSATQAPSARYLSCCPPFLAPTEGSEKTAARSKSRERNREWSRKRYSENQAFREYKAAHVIKYQSKKASADPDWAQARKEYKAAWYKQKNCDEQYIGRSWFRRWLVAKFSQGREDLIWKTYVPILYEHRVRHTCSACGYETRNGLKLWCKYKDLVSTNNSEEAAEVVQDCLARVTDSEKLLLAQTSKFMCRRTSWQQISDPNIYKCHRCYCSPEVLKAMPVGYEDVYVKWWNNRHSSSETGSSSLQPSSDEADSRPHTGKKHEEDEKSNS